MSRRLPRVTASEVIKVLNKLDFSLARQSGSHKIFKNKEGRRVPVPFHAGKILHPKVLKNILTDADLKINEFMKLLLTDSYYGIHI